MPCAQVAALGLLAEPSALPSSSSLGAAAEAQGEEAGEVQLLWGGAGGMPGLSEGPLPPSLPRPPGLLMLLGPREGVLWLANTCAQVCGIWVRCVCSDGVLWLANTCAQVCGL